VYNAIARKYGAIDAVHIEFTRDIKKSHDDRKKIEKAQGEFRVAKEEAMSDAMEVLGYEPSAKELLKFRLWREQNGFCIYSGEEIRPHKLRDPQATQIDHILPYSRSLDDSLNNKVLCLIKENQEKGNKTPFEYMGEDRFYEFKQRLESYKNIKQAKKQRLLKTNFDASSEESFRDRNKNDTSYIARFIKNYIESHIAFRESKQKRHIFTMNGMLTSQLRYKWGVGDKNRDNHLHHAEDAIILAFSTAGMVKKLSDVSSKREGWIYKTKEEKSKNLKFEPPLEDFGQRVRESVSEIFVSQMPRRKVGGAGHKETIYSKKIKSRGVIEVNNGVAENGEVKRIDIFEKDGKYHFIYLYPIDFLNEQLKNVTIKNKIIDDSYEFKFSIFKNDLIEMQLKDKIVFGYLHFAEGDGRFNILEHEKSILDKKENRHSTGSMKYIKKYQVDPLGNYVEVKQEKRQGTIKEGRKLRKAKKGR
ncbi:MAG: type II CRISPR RNA-guided endonuclease Cas9, partial [Campylobacterales bacterium]|nr:type II CRISPR RNA-guided endonuclease Cas9 [Campylobacterales bacterium]